MFAVMDSLFDFNKKDMTEEELEMMFLKNKLAAEAPVANKAPQPTAAALTV